MYTYVTDNLDLSVAEMKNILRLNDEMVGKLSRAHLAGEGVLALDNIMYARVGQYVNVGSEMHAITHIDWVNNELALEDDIIAGYTTNTPVYTHVDNGLILGLINSAKAALDEFLQQPDEAKLQDKNGKPLPIIKTWVARHVARLYEQPISGLVSESVTGVGSASYSDAEWYGEIHRLRNMKGMA